MFDQSEQMFDQLGEAVVVDVETTGLKAQEDRILSVSILHTDFSNIEPNGQLNGSIEEWIFNPQCKIPKQSTEVHGIKNKDVKGKPTFSDKANEIREYIGALPLVGHNVSFDKRFLSAEFKRAGIKTLHRNKPFCTMRRYQQWNNWIRKGSNLDEAGEQLGIPGRKGSTHSSLEDVVITAKIAATFVLFDRGQIDLGSRPGFSKKAVQKSNSSLTRWVIFGVLCGLLYWWIF